MDRHVQVNTTRKYVPVRAFRARMYSGGISPLTGH